MSKRASLRHGVRSPTCSPNYSLPSHRTKIQIKSPFGKIAYFCRHRFWFLLSKLMKSTQQNLRSRKFPLRQRKRERERGRQYPVQKACVWQAMSVMIPRTRPHRRDPARGSAITHRAFVTGSLSTLDGEASVLTVPLPDWFCVGHQVAVSAGLRGGPSY